MPDVDVAIVGAGPAGCVAALAIAARRPAWRIVLADALPEPRPRACGEFVAPDGVEALRALGVLDDVLATRPQPIAGLVLHGAGATLARAFGERRGLGVRRERFDAALQAAAARRAELRRGARLATMTRDGDGWRLAFADGATMSSALVVGADGRGSLVRRLAGLERAHRRRRFALACRARGVAHGDRGEMHLSPLGQVGLCPLGDGEVNLNLLLAPASRALVRRLGPARLLALALRATPTLRDRARGAALGEAHATGSLPQASAIVGARVALVGDAAGFCDPFTGEGIDLAIAGGRLLGDALGHAHDAPAAALADYADAWRRRIGARHRLGEALQLALARRPVAEAALRALAAQGSARTLLAR